MNKPRQPESEAEQYALDVEAFLKTPFGEQFVTNLSLKYNALHQASEGAGLSTEEIAFCIHQASGIKQVINDLLAQPELLKGGYFESPKG